MKYLEILWIESHDFEDNWLVLMNGNENRVWFA